MSEQDKKDLEQLDAAIARVKKVIENDVPDEETREELNRELAIFVEMRRKIAGPPH